MPATPHRDRIDQLAARAAALDPDRLARSASLLQAHRRFMILLFALLAAVPALALLLR